MSCPAEAATGATILIVMALHSEQVEQVFFGTKGAISVVPQGAAIILCGTFSPTYIMKLAVELSGQQKGLLLVDAPLSMDASLAEEESLLVMASGTDEGVEKVRPVLSAMCKKFLHIEGGVSAASKMTMVDKLLAGVQTAAAAEAMVLGASAGINTRGLFNIISNAAGSSRAFVSRVPQMLDDLMISKSALNTVVDYLGLILDEARVLAFPLPLTAIAHQQFLLGSSSGYGNESDAAVVKVWEKTAGISVVASSMDGGKGYLDGKDREFIKGAIKVQRVGFIGLGAMGFGMAATLLDKEFEVCGFDVYGPTLARFKDLGGKTGNSAAEAAKGAQVLVLMVATEDQVETAIFGDHGVMAALSDGCTIILCSTVSPLYVKRLEERLQAEGRDFQLVDAPVSGGVKRAANGTLTIMAAGSEEAFKRAGMVLSALSETLYIIDGGPGSGSGVKVVNQLLAGVHIAAAAEGIAFGARLGLNTRNLYQVVSHTNGSSWMFVDRVPHMLDADYTPRSAVNIFVKDLGIVLSQGKRFNIPLYLAATAHQQFLLAAAGGWAREDDSSVVKIYEKLTGITVASKEKSPLTPSHSVDQVHAVSRIDVFKSLIPEWPEDPFDQIHKCEGTGLAKVLVVLDDDPTGTQTVHGVTVLTEWSVGSIQEQFQKQSKCFFILTNSRALSREKAFSLIQEISTNVKAAAALTNSLFTIVLRGDSTLRGHFPEEPDAVASVIGETDAWIICPFFPQGGRYTINDVHYVADEEKLIPAGQTEFAKDSVFGYQSSDLKEWVEEKTKGRVKAENVVAVSIQTIRKGGPRAVSEQLCSLPKGSICIVNAATETDIEVFSAGMIQAEIKGKRFLCRTAATFVSARIGMKYKPPITPKEFGASSHIRWRNGGLIVVGSYVPKTTKQVEELKVRCAHFIHFLVVEVPALAFGSASSWEAEINQIAVAASALIAAGKDTLIMTSRELITGNNASESLEIHSKVSSALVEIVKRIQERPRYLLAKGGITSSDLATKAMGARRADVIGQALAGVPIWKLGEGSRHPGIPYIVFPGNVGSTVALAEIVESWACKPRQSTKDLLHAAEQEGYAVGAFNVYNLEGVSAVVDAAEAEKAPAILQIHPSALEHGKMALITACIAAAKDAVVPITVHLDHGYKEQEIINAMDMGFDSIMIDFSHLPFEENLVRTKRITEVALAKHITVEAELGRLSGTEDGMTVEEYEAKLTDVFQARNFLKETRVDALAVCIGNVHGKYPPSGPKINLGLLQELRQITSEHNAVLVLHGASGLPGDVVKECIKLGVRKFNVNTEVRSAYMAALKTTRNDLLDVMSSAKEAMQAVVAEKLRLFGSAGKAF